MILWLFFFNSTLKLLLDAIESATGLSAPQYLV